MNNSNIKTEYRECKKHGLALYKKYSNNGYKCNECIKENIMKYRKKKLKEVNSTCKCGNTKIHYSEQCITCYYASRPQKIDWPTIEELVTALQIKPYTRLAKELNVSDNAIRKHLKKHNIDPKTLKPFKENLQNYKS